MNCQVLALADVVHRLPAGLFQPYGRPATVNRYIFANQFRFHDFPAGNKPGNGISGLRNMPPVFS